MIEDFLRPPRTSGEWLGDAVRVVGVLSVLGAVIWLRPTDTGVLALVLPGLLLLRALGLVPWFDILSGIVLLSAAWSNVFELYVRIWWWDLAVHFLCTGVLAAVAYLSLRRAGVVVEPRPTRTARVSTVLITASVGLALSAIWEMIEWIGHTFISAEIFVEYGDTIGDMAIGGAGAVAAGFLVAFVRVEMDRATRAESRLGPSGGASRDALPTRPHLPALRPRSREAGTREQRPGR